MINNSNSDSIFVSKSEIFKSFNESTNNIAYYINSNFQTDSLTATRANVKPMMINNNPIFSSNSTMLRDNKTNSNSENSIISAPLIQI